MILDAALLIAGLVLLIFSADQFVVGASRVAQVWDVPPVVVGAVVMGFGTSAPELVVSTTAASQGDLALGVGNVVGSNVANLSLVLAAAALTTRLVISPTTMRREAPLSIAATVGFARAGWAGELTFTEGALLGIALVLVIAFLLAVGVVEGDLDDKEERPLRGSHELGRVAMGLLGTVLAARLVVDGSTGLAEAWELTGGFVGFSLVAVGTSLPELVTTLAAARRGETGLIVGNLLGSNVFNSLAVGAGMGLLGAGAINDDSLVGTGVVVMLIVAVVSFVLASFGLRLGRWDGLALLAIYAVAMLLLIGDADADGEDDDVHPMAAVVTIDDG